MKVVDTNSRRYIESTVLCGGDHRGQTLGDVARTPEGILYLGVIQNTPDKYPWVNNLLTKEINRFFECPRRLDALEIAFSQYEMGDL